MCRRRGKLNKYLTTASGLHIVSVCNYKRIKNLTMINSDNFPRLSRKEFLILEMLADKDEMFGLEMAQLSNGELKRGTIYVTLQRMSEKRLVESFGQPRTSGEIGIARRIYKATEFGKKIFKAQELAIKYLNMNLIHEDFKFLGGR